MNYKCILNKINKINRLTNEIADFIETYMSSGNNKYLYLSEEYTEEVNKMLATLRRKIKSNIKGDDTNA